MTHKAALQSHRPPPSGGYVFTLLLQLLVLSLWLLTQRLWFQEQIEATILNLLLPAINISAALLQWRFHSPRQDSPQFAAPHEEQLDLAQSAYAWQFARLSPPLNPDATALALCADRPFPLRLIKSDSAEYRPLPRALPFSRSTRLTAVSQSIRAETSRSTDVLLVCVTAQETRALLALFPRFSKAVIQNRTYYLLGNLGETSTVLVQATGMGPSGIRPCIEDGIRAHRPLAIIMVGVAFGLQDAEQELGDILVSRQVQDYDPQRWGTGSDQQLIIHNRGNRVPATEWLLDRFAAGKQDWRGESEVHTGLFLSGSLLIDHPAIRENMLQAAPEAVGGEMEGATFCDIALRHHVSWIVVKAIADWADGQKRLCDKDQQLRSAKNAARFVCHVLQQPGFIQQP